MRIRGCLLQPNRPAWLAGPNGLRAGWRIALFLALLILQLAILAAGVVVVVTHALHIHPSRHSLFGPGAVLLNELTLLLPVLGATAAMAVLEDAAFVSYGLAGPAKSRHFRAGFVTGLAGLSLLVAALAATGYGALGPGGFGTLANLRFALEWLFVSLLTGFTEELLFRGYIFSTITRGTGIIWATLVTSLIFAAAHGHNAGETYIGLALAFGAGLVFCMAIHFTQSLWWAIGMHGAWDYAENYVYGTRDSGTACYGTLFKLNPHGNVFLSGGVTGPEGSVFSLVIIALIGLALFARYRITNR